MGGVHPERKDNMDEFLSKLFTRMSDEEWIDPDRVTDATKVLYEAFTGISHNLCPKDQELLMPYLAQMMCWTVSFKNCDTAAQAIIRQVRGCDE